MDTVRKKKERPKWQELPDIVVEQIFAYLEKRSRYNAACTCRAWSRVLHYPALWKTFKIRERTLTRSRFDYYKGYQDVLDPFVTARCLKTVGWHFRRLTILPLANFKNLFEFINIVDSFASYYDTPPMPHLTSFEFQFACQIRSVEGIQTFGTGGRILESLTTLMGHLTTLREVKLVNLLLERYEAVTLLDKVLQTCGDRLWRLTLINCTKMNYFFMHSGLFLNMRSLTISVNHLHRDLLYMIGDLASLEEFHIIHTEFTTSTVHLAPRDWTALAKNSDRIKLFLESRVQCMNVTTLEDYNQRRTKEEIAWQAGAPVHHIVHATPYNKLTYEAARNIFHQYDSTLLSYCQFGIPRFSYRRGRPFHERCDAHLLLMLRICTKVTTVVLHELISTSTLLLICFFTRGRGLNLHVRRNAVLLRMDWSLTDRDPTNEWSPEFKTWLKTSSQNYAVFEEEMCKLLGRKWRMLTDMEFKKLSVAILEE